MGNLQSPMRIVFLGVVFQSLALSILTFLSSPVIVEAQYAPKYTNPTMRLLDQRVNGCSGDLQLSQVVSQINSQVGLKLICEQKLYEQKVKIAPADPQTARGILQQIDATSELNVLIRDWEVLIVSDIDDQDIVDLRSKVKDLDHVNHGQAIEEMLNLSTPEIYPVLFWAMANDSPELAKTISRDLLQNHREMMPFSPNFEFALAGFKRAFEIEDQAIQALAYIIPQPVLKDVDLSTFPNGNQYFKQLVQDAKESSSFTEIKTAYAKAPPSPDSWPWCGTGYVHVLNHYDYVCMIGDLRTEEAYEFLINQANRLSDKPSPANHEKLAELAIGLANRDTDDALRIANTIIDQRNLKQAPPGVQVDFFLGNNAMQQMVKVLASTRQEKYLPVFRNLCDSKSTAVRQECFAILHRRESAKLLEIGLAALDRLREQASIATTPNEKVLANHDRYHMGSCMSLFRDASVKNLFLERLDDPKFQDEAAGYFSTTLGEQSVVTLKKLRRIASQNSEVEQKICVELIKRDDLEELLAAQQRLKDHFASRLKLFKEQFELGFSRNHFASYSAHFTPDLGVLIQKPSSVEFALDLMSTGDPDQELIGAAILCVAPSSLINSDVRKQVERFEDGPNEWTRRTVKAILADD